MRTVPVSLGGVTYYLLLNAAAAFELYDRFGDKGSLADHLQGGGRDAFENTCFFLEKLAEQGELWRRYLGYGPGPLPSMGQFFVTLSPMEAAAAKSAVMEALAAGFAREEAKKPKMVDKGLLALQKKTEAGLSAESTCTWRCGSWAWGFRKRCCCPLDSYLT